MCLALEECAVRGIDLTGVNLLKMKPCHCNLNGLRAQCLYAKRKWNDWKRSGYIVSYPHLKFYAHVEGVLLRRHAQDAAMLYRLVFKDRMTAFRGYVENLSIRSGICGDAR